MSYNIKVVQIDPINYAIWLDTRRWHIQQAVVTNDVDIVGFQEARSQTFGREQTNQQSDLEETFNGTPYKLYRWDDTSIEPYINESQSDLAYYNKNPIAIHDRCTVIADGTALIKWTDVLSQIEWEELHTLHVYFHGGDRDDDGINEWAHHFDPIRHATWVVLEKDGNRFMVINTHYETYPGENEYEDQPESAEKWTRFLELIDRSFLYTAEQLVLHAQNIASTHNVEKLIIMGDFEEGEEGHRWLQPFVDAGYIETWWAVPHSGTPRDTRRPVGGVDHIYARPDNIVIDSFYDLNDLYTGRDIASDHYPLVAVLEN